MSGSRMPLQTALFVFMSFVELSCSAHHTTATLGLMAAALVGVFVRGLVPVPRAVFLPVLLLLALLLFNPPLPPPSQASFLVSSAYAAGLFGGVLLLIYLVRRNSRREQLLTVLMALVVSMLAGTTLDRFPFFYLLVIQAVLLGLSLRQHLPGADTNTWRSLIPATFMLVLMGAAALTLQRSEATFNQMLRLFEPPTIGCAFDTKVTLGSVTGSQGSDRVLARMVSVAPATYYVGRAYVKYGRSSWESVANPREVPRVTQSAWRQPGLTVFGLRAQAADFWHSFQPQVVDSVTLEGSLNSQIFAPRDAVMLAVDVPTVHADRCGVLFNPQNLTLGTYEVARRPDALPMRGSEDESLLAMCREIPADTNAYVRPLALAVTHRCRDDRARAVAIVSFLQQMYTYKKGVSFNNRADPVKEFLLEKKAAHCEFFATAMTLMLRSIGIPARYINGFLVMEKNHSGGYWVVRDEHAHAWVEAYLPRDGWVEYDPTPPEGRPQAKQQDRLSELGDMVVFRLQRLKSLLTEFDPRKLGQYLLNGAQGLGKWLIQKWWRIGALLFLFAMEQLFRLPDAPGRRWLRRRRRVAPGGLTEHELALRLQELLRRFDSALRRRRLERPPHLTLLEFARELTLQPELSADERGTAERFLREYSQVRYRTEVPQADAVADLEKVVAALEQAKK